MMDSSDSNRITKRCVKMTKKQALVMVEFMEANQDFACGRYESPNRRAIMMKMWNELKGLLDMYGAPKTLEQWKRAWKDLRAKTRAKNVRLLAERSALGYDQENSANLSNLELRVLEIIGVSTSSPAQNSSLKFESSLPERVKCVSNAESISIVMSGSKTPELQLPATQTTVRSTNNSRQAVNSHKLDVSGRSKVVLTNDRLDDILSKLETFRAESLDLMKVIADGISTLAKGQKDMLIIQKEKLEFQRETLRLERERAESQVKMESFMMDIVECQRRMAAAQEQRVLCSLDEQGNL